LGKLETADNNANDHDCRASNHCNRPEPLAALVKLEAVLITGLVEHRVDYFCSGRTFFQVTKVLFIQR